MTIAEQLGDLARLEENGTLSHEEFITAKTRLLSAEPFRDDEHPVMDSSATGGFSPDVPKPKSSRGLRLRLSGYFVFAVIVGVAGVVYSNSDPSIETASRQRRSSEETKSLALRNEALRSEEARKQAAYKSCNSEIGPLLAALQHLNSRLDVGLTFTDYGSQVGTLSVRYNSIAFRSLGADCIAGPGVASENAFNAYSRAYQKWNSCIGDIYCAENSIDPYLQSQWARASVQISRAVRTLKALGN